MIDLLATLYQLIEGVFREHGASREQLQVA